MNNGARSTMKSFFLRSTVVISAMLLMVPGVLAGTKGRIIPDKSVSLEKNGTVSKFNEQTVIDENALMACDGNCMVKLRGVSLVAVNQSKFAVKENSEMLNLYVEQGRVSFVLADTAQTFAFYTPDHHHIITEGFIAPASANPSIEGFMNVTDKAVEIGMERGSMIVQTAEGSQTINAGQSMMLAQADVPSNPAAGANAASGVGGAGAGGAAGAGAAGAAAAGGGFFSSLGLAGMIGIGAATVAVVGVVASQTVLKDDEQAPASPNQ